MFSVTIVLVNWNRCDDILENLELLRNNVDLTDTQILVVDNGSTDDSVNRLKEEPNIELIQMPENRGPSAARNAAMDKTLGRYTLYLDSDAFIRDELSLPAMVARMDEDLSIGALGCTVLRDGSDDIDQWIYAQDQSTHRGREFDTYSFSAAGALLRTEALKEAGGFWNALFMYNEEVDLSIRLIRNGYRILYFPGAAVHHRCTAAGRVPPGRYFELQARNWIWIFFRHYPWPERYLQAALYSGVYLVKGIANFKLWSAIRGIVRGWKELNLVSQYEDKLSTAQIQTLQSLNRRRKVRLGR